MYGPKAKYHHHRQRPPSDFVEHPITLKGKKTSKFKIVPIEHTEYKGKKYNKKGVKAVVGVLKKKNRKPLKLGGKPRRQGIQSILTPKKLNIKK